MYVNFQQKFHPHDNLLFGLSKVSEFIDISTCKHISCDAVEETRKATLKIVFIDSSISMSNDACQLRSRSPSTFNAVKRF